MISYKDKTWCSQYASGNCANSKCSFAFTDEEYEIAKEWWGGVDCPIMMGDRKTDDCGYEE